MERFGVEDPHEFFGDGGVEPVSRVYAAILDSYEPMQEGIRRVSGIHRSIDHQSVVIHGPQAAAPPNLDK